jgi:hypothetical protein
VREWLEQNGLDLADPLVSSEAGQVVKQVHFCSRVEAAPGASGSWLSSRNWNEPFVSASSVSSARAEPSATAYFAMVGALVVIWLCGLRLIWRAG